MTNRAINSWALRLGSVLLGLLAGVTGGPLRAADAPPAECTSCHEQGAKLAKSAHAPPPCDTCHKKHENFPPPAGVEKPACVTCHADQAGDYAQSAHGLAR